ncbi:MAG: class II SORL domain-containing protein [Nitrospirota bacterium]|nr:class II SORL domain-containing protein [Nitrospirota bacterium]
MIEKGLLCGNNKPKDITNMTDFEKKHMPVIGCPDTVKAGEPFQVKIKIGEIPHVMEEGHFIQWLEVKFGESLYARVELTPALSLPDIMVTLVKGAKHNKGTLRVIERCNLHGAWEATKEITITEPVQKG